jgi:hypothetical protein
MVGRLLFPQWINKISVAGVTGMVCLANAPDLDLLVGPLIGEHHHYLHGQVTHSIAFAVVSGLLVWLGLRLVKTEHKYSQLIGALVFSGLISHVIVDWFTGPNPGWNPSFGIVVLWPFVSERLQSPFTLFLGPHHGSMTEFLSLHNVWVMVSELLIFGGFAVLLLFISSSLRVQIKHLFQDVLAARFR